MIRINHSFKYSTWKWFERNETLLFWPFGCREQRAPSERNELVYGMWVLQSNCKRIQCERAASIPAVNEKRHKKRKEEEKNV